MLVDQEMERCFFSGTEFLQTNPGRKRGAMIPRREAVNLQSREAKLLSKQLVRDLPGATKACI